MTDKQFEELKKKLDEIRDKPPAYVPYTVPYPYPVYPQPYYIPYQPYLYNSPWWQGQYCNTNGTTIPCTTTWAISQSL